MVCVTSDALGVYPVNRYNKEKLKCCEYKETVYNEQVRGRVFIFTDNYRKLNIDLIFTDCGELFISDYYGEDMNRDTIFYVPLRT